MTQGPTISRVISTTMIVLAVVTFFVQIPIDDSSENIAASCIALVGSLIGLSYIRYTDAIDTHPISTFAIVGFLFTSIYGALLAQTASLTSLANNLRRPVETFSILLLFLVVAIAAHMTYRYFSNTKLPVHNVQSKFGVRSLLERLGLYQLPTLYQLWILGLIGMVAIVVSGSDPDEKVGSKIGAGMIFLAWAPFLIPVYFTQLGRQYCNAKVHYPLLIGFAGLFVLIGIASNARYMIVAGLGTVSLIILLIGMRSKRVATSKQILIAVLMMAVGALMVIPVSQLATAMVVVRDSSPRLNPVNKFYATLDVLGRPESIETYRQKFKMAATFSPYDEYYFENPIMARLVMTKFADNALYFESRLTERGQEELIDTTIDLIWAILPDPVLKYIGVKIPKKHLRFSMGDFMYYQATGGALGGYKVGSNIAHGLGIFGPFFPVVFFGICCFTFLVLDLLSFKKKSGEVLLSVVGALEIWHLFMAGVSQESLNATVAFLFREIPQSILIFVICYQISRLISYPILLTDQLRSKKVILGKIE